MIESIERLDAQFEGPGFRKTHILLKRQVKVLYTAAVENATPCVAELSKVLFRKELCIKGRFSISAIRVDLKRPRLISRSIQEVIIDPIAQRAQE